MAPGAGSGPSGRTRQPHGSSGVATRQFGRERAFNGLEKRKVFLQLSKPFFGGEQLLFNVASPEVYFRAIIDKSRRPACRFEARSNSFGFLFGRRNRRPHGSQDKHEALLIRSPVARRGTKIG
jgi:hypothetical protein